MSQERKSPSRSAGHYANFIRQLDREAEGLDSVRFREGDLMALLSWVESEQQVVLRALPEMVGSPVEYTRTAGRYDALGIVGSEFVRLIELGRKRKADEEVKDSGGKSDVG